MEQEVKLIDANKLKNHYAWWENGTAEMTLDRAKQIFDTIIDVQPTVDAVPVVRCKDCKYAHMTYGGECKYCDCWEEEGEMYLDGDFYCAFGKRREDAEID